MRGPGQSKRRTQSGHTSGSLPLPTLLSEVLIAFTIEFDNEFEHRSPHWTTQSGRARGAANGAWLTSMVMWSNLMRVLPEQGLTIAELRRQTRTPRLSLHGMARWGYITVRPDAADTRAKPRKDAWLVRPTAKGRAAQLIWRPLFAVIEERWQERFGKDQIHRLRDSLQGLVSRLGRNLPEYIPVLGYGFFTDALASEECAPEEREEWTLAALLAKVLLAFTLEFESDSPVSLAMAANVLRVLGEEPVPLRDLPGLTGVSKEAISMAASYLPARRLATVEPDAASGRGQAIRLTAQGMLARDAYGKKLRSIEEGWRTRFGADEIGKLRAALEQLAIAPDGGESPLWAGLTPYSDGWRASVRKPELLPHYPMVLHRGGYPDGS